MDKLVGLTQRLQELDTEHEDEELHRAEVADDFECEIESMEAADDIEDELQKDASYIHTSEPSSASSSDPGPAATKKQKLVLADLAKNIEKASEHVIVPGTLNEYRNLWKTFTLFCIAFGFIEASQNNDAFWTSLPAVLPTWIAAWIMSKADDIDLITGEEKELANTDRVTYARAQKMRASISHKFGREYKRGTQLWTESPIAPGVFMGNPSLSVVVSEYMISLRRRKVRTGEVVTSARAMDQATMKRLWTFNLSYPREAETRPLKRGDQHSAKWAGYKTRQMLQLLYITSMTCLLRFEEALRIMWSDVEFTERNGCPVVVLSLPFRKTHQVGDIQPFVLYPDDDRPWMCPVTAWARWWEICQEMHVEQYGFVFRSRRNGSDEVSVLAESQMSSQTFLKCFRNNMADIGIDPRPYGTHSFRRGGCQYLHTELRWPMQQICDWGGWAEDFDNPTTIFRYLLSWVDKGSMHREDYMNPNRPGADPCTRCNRTCHCA
ncbi:hypothetical protein OH76DRAFT_1419903 [Lentinus brumalis]|uniref:DNA breaking-rejoining enzyme n=1 Tax=Lentinus brumalis TaxID=2498619 RepID=A0A371D2V4_9APHY|nr:hypothetical protein OH76DRAFT_1419903 [Polyporus brumalis]